MENYEWRITNWELRIGNYEFKILVMKDVNVNSVCGLVEGAGLVCLYGAVSASAICFRPYLGLSLVVP